MLPPPPSIAAAPPKPSEATEAKPNNRAQPEEIQSTRNGDAIPTTRPEQVQVPNDHHNNPSNNTKGKQARDDTNGTNLSSPSNSTNIGNSSSKPSDVDNNDHISGRNHNRTYDPGGLSNCDSRRVHDLGGNTLNNKDGVSCNDHSSSNSDIMFCAVNTHHIHSRNFMRTNAVSDTASPCTFDNPPTIPYLDAKRTNAARCPLSPQRLADSLNVDTTLDIACISPALCLNTSHNSSSNIVPCADDIHHTSDRNRNKPVSAASNAKPLCGFKQANHHISSAISPHPADDLPTILYLDTKCTNATQCSLPCDFDPPQASSSKPDSIRDATHSLNISNADISISRSFNATRITSNVDTTASNHDSKSNSIHPITPEVTRAPPNQYLDNATDNNANNVSRSSCINASDADANTLDDNSGTDIIPSIDSIHISTSTTTPDNEPERKYKHARLPPSDINCDVPPSTVPHPDKPEDPPPHWTHVDAVDNSSVTDFVHSNEPEHECARMTCTPPFEVRTQVPPVVAPPPDKPEEPPPARPTNKLASPNSEVMQDYPTVAHNLHAPLPVFDNAPTRFTGKRPRSILPRDDLAAKHFHSS
jgi:hypothetical protein